MTKFLLVLFALVSLSNVSSDFLTKEIPANQLKELGFKDIVAQLDQTTIPGEVISWIISNFEGAFLNVATLLQSQNIPDIPKLLNDLNTGLGARVLVLNKNSVQVSPEAFENLLSEKTWSLIQSTFPKNYYEQLFVYGVVQKEIQRAVEDIRPEFENRKLYAEEIADLIASEQRGIALRASNSSNIIEDLISSLQTTICDNMVNVVYSRVNETLTTANTFLDSIVVNNNSTGINSLVGDLIAACIDVAKQQIALVLEVAGSFKSSVCSSIVSRKRRDLTLLENSFDGLRAATSLTKVESQVIGVRTIGIILGLLGTILGGLVSFVVSSIVNQIMLMIVQYLAGVIASWLGSIIDSLF